MVDTHSVMTARRGKYGAIRFGLNAAAMLLLLGGCRPPQSQPPQPVNTEDLPTVSDQVADSLLVDLKSVDSTIVVDMRYATPNNFTRAKLPGYEENRAYLRAEAAAALSLVQEDLGRQGMGLKILDAYRPVRASEAMVAWTQRVNRPDLLRDGYIAARSRHNLGVAVDLTLVDIATKGELNMGTPFDNFSLAAHTANARGVVAQNRQTLKKVMERQGFVNYEKEWWHYSYPVTNPVRFDKVIQ
jgi:D-alanyl-D-alanine dipeptidase